MQQLDQKALGQIYNVLIILAITLLMAVAVTVLAYFIDFAPPIVGSDASVTSNLLALQGN